MKKLHKRLTAYLEKRAFFNMCLGLGIWAMGICCIVGGLKCEIAQPGNVIFNFGCFLLMTAAVICFVHVCIACSTIIKSFINCFKALRKNIFKKRKKVRLVYYEKRDVSYVEYEDSEVFYVKYEDSDTYYMEFKY